MSIYALTYSLIAAEELIKLSLVFINNNFSFKTTLFYIRERRRQYLFDKYCKELWLEEDQKNYCTTGQNIKKINNMEVNEDTIFCDPKLDLEFINYSDIEIATGRTELDSASYEYETHFYDTIDPFLVFSNSNLGEIKEGVRIRISGLILYNCERFSINLILDTPKSDIALHINPRLPQNYIVRNCRIKGYWGSEENSSHAPFTLKRGNRFSVQILITNEEYLISIDDKHYACFRHRVPYNHIKCLEVKGGVDDIDCNITHVNQYPNYEIFDKVEAKRRLSYIAKTEITQPTPAALNDMKRNVAHIMRRRSSVPKKYLIGPSTDDSSDNAETDLQRHSQILQIRQKQYDEDGLKKGLSLPFYGSLSENLINGKKLKFKGRIKILPHSFFINLQSGHNIWPHPTIAFHFNPRFAIAEGKHVICRNSWSDGKWNNEERSELNTDFTPGRPFTLNISCTEHQYEVFLNSKLIITYKYHVDPIIVDTVYIQGDIKLWEISLE